MFKAPPNQSLGSCHACHACHAEEATVEGLKSQRMLEGSVIEHDPA